jgi:hypothetical protein
MAMTTVMAAYSIDERMPQTSSVFRSMLHLLRQQRMNLADRIRIPPRLRMEKLSQPDSRL